MKRFEEKIDGEKVNFLVLAQQQKARGLWKGWNLERVASELRRAARERELAQKNPEGDILWA